MNKESLVVLAIQHHLTTLSNNTKGLLGRLSGSDKIHRLADPNARESKNQCQSRLVHTIILRLNSLSWRGAGYSGTHKFPE